MRGNDLSFIFTRDDSFLLYHNGISRGISRVSSRYSLKRYVENFFVDFNKLDRLNNLRILEKFNSEYTVYTSPIVNNTKFTK